MRLKVIRSGLVAAVFVIVSNVANSQPSLPIVGNLLVEAEGQLLSIPELVSALPGLNAGLPGLDVLPAGVLVDAAGPVIEGLLLGLPVGPGLDVLDPLLDLVPLGLASGVAIDIPSIPGLSISGLFESASAVTPLLELLPIDVLLGASSPVLGIVVSDLPVGNLASEGLPLLSPLTLNALEFPLFIDSLVGSILFQ